MNAKPYRVLLTINNLTTFYMPPSSPFYGKRFLSYETEAYILETAGNFPERASFQIVIRMNDEFASEKEAIVEAIRRHFNYLKVKSQMSLKHALKIGFKSLVVAVIFLGLLVSFSYLVTDRLFFENLAITFREFLVIMGWVALWRPADILLYEWRPYKRNVKLHERLEKSVVTFE